MELLLKHGSCLSIDKHLAEVAASQLKHSKAESTRRAYRSDMRNFSDWCNRFGRESLPAQSESVRFYIVELSEVGIKPSSIARKLSSISQAHKLLSLPNPCDSLVLEQFKAIRRERGSIQRKAKPLLVCDIKKICDVLKPDVIDTRDRALLLIGWAAALRRSEISALRISDLEFSDEGLIITLRRSKTDQLGKGQKVAIPKLAGEQEKYCAVHAVRRWLSLSRPIDENEPVFKAVGKRGRNVFFSKIGGNALDSKTVSNIVKRLARLIGLNPAQYSAHSLRSGWATEAARIGLGMPALMQHTRHRSERVAIGYIRESNLFRCNPIEMFFPVFPPLP